MGILTEREGCAAFYFLKKGYPKDVIAKYFDVSESIIKSLTKKGYYENVKRKYDEYGDLEAFGSAYVEERHRTEMDIWDRRRAYLHPRRKRG